MLSFLFTLYNKQRLVDFFLKRSKWLLYSGAFLFSLFSFFLTQKKPSSKSPSPLFSQRQESLDTFIPRGFVLIPIEIENQNALENTLGEYGVVDLYASSHSDPSQFQLIVKNIQILRSSYPPYEFAVMSPEEKAKFILQFNGAFKVTIKNPQKTGTYFEAAVKKHQNIGNKRKIVVDQ